MEYYTLIRHQSFVAALGSRNLPLRLVYAHILGYTLRKGAWQGDVKELATQIELPIQTVRDQLKTLTTMGLLTINGNTYTATVPDNTTTVLTDTRTVQNNTAAVQPQTPINYINKMERNEIIAHANMRDAQPKPSSFEEFLSAYQAKAGKWQIPDAVLRECQNLWADCPDWKKRMLITRVQDGTWFKPRIDWTISDFNPAPHNYNGDRSISTTDFENMIRTGQLVTAKWNGSWGKYTPADVTAFALESYVPPTKEK